MIEDHPDFGSAFQRSEFRFGVDAKDHVMTLVALVDFEVVFVGCDVPPLLNGFAFESLSFVVEHIQFRPIECSAKRVEDLKVFHWC